MHFFSNAMPYKLANDTIGMLLTMVLYSRTNVTETFPMHSILYTLIQGFLCNSQKSFNFGRNFTYTKCIGRITTKPVHKSSTIDRYNITFL